MKKRTQDQEIEETGSGWDGSTHARTRKSTTSKVCRSLRHLGDGTWPPPLPPDGTTGASFMRFAGGCGTSPLSLSLSSLPLPLPLSISIPCFVGAKCQAVLPRSTHKHKRHCVRPLIIPVVI